MGLLTLRCPLDTAVSWLSIGAAALVPVVALAIVLTDRRQRTYPAYVHYGRSLSGREQDGEERTMIRFPAAELPTGAEANGQR